MRLWARVAIWWLRESWARLPIGVRFMWLLLGVMVGLMTPLLGVGYRLLQQSLEAHQQLVQRQRLEAVVSALERELAALLRQVQDYTVWDDAHAAVSRRDAPWIRRNITEWLPQQFHYDFAVVVDAQGAWTAHTAGDWAWLRQTAPFQQAMRGVSSAGLHRHGETIYLLSAAPFVDEACSRPPAGVLVAGRALDATLLRRISQSAGHMGAVQLEAVVAFSDADRQLTLRKMLGQSVQKDSDPLLQVPPASRGNQAPARLLPRNGGSQAPERFPSRSGGNLKEGGEQTQGALPCAPTPLAHAVGEGMGANNALMLASYLAPAPMPREVRIPLNRRAQWLYLLHTAGWQTEQGREVGRLVVEYADGAQAEQPILYGRHLRAWNDRLYALEGLPLWRARDAEGSLATVRLLHWRNPHPDKLIRAVRFVAIDPIAGWTLLALSGE
jgi:CHASE4 domain.